MRLNQVKERMAGLEIKVWELYHSIKGNFESKKKKTQNKTYRITYRTNTNNRTEKEETQAKAAENIFKKNLKKKSTLIEGKRYLSKTKRHIEHQTERTKDSMFLVKTLNKRH